MFVYSFFFWFIFSFPYFYFSIAFFLSLFLSFSRIVCFVFSFSCFFSCFFVVVFLPFLYLFVFLFYFQSLSFLFYIIFTIPQNVLFNSFLFFLCSHPYYSIYPLFYTLFPYLLSPFLSFSLFSLPRPKPRVIPAISVAGLLRLVITFVDGLRYDSQLSLIPFVPGCLCYPRTHTDDGTLTHTRAPMLTRVNTHERGE